MKFKNDIEAQADISVTGDVNIGGTGQANRKLKVHGNASIDGGLYLTGASTAYSIEVGQSRSVDGVAFLDLTGEVAPDDYGLRMIRYGGLNAESKIIHTGTANLTINASNGADTVFTNTNVGIGTTNAKTLLHLRKDTATAGSESIVLLDNRQTGTGSYYSGGLWGAGYRDVADPGYLAGIDFLRTSQSGGLSSQGEMIFYTTTIASTLSSVRASNERMRIDSVGNVGIGTDDPSELLNLSSTGPARLLIEADTDNVTETDNAQIILKQDGGAVVGRLGFKTGTNSLEIWNQYAENLIFGTNNTQRLYIQSSGASTFTGISDYSTVKLSRWNTAGNTIHRTGLVTQNYLGAEQDTAMLIGYVDAAQSVISLGGSSSVHNTATKLRFYTAANTTTLTGTERMTILNNGYVGINDPTPAYQLDVAGIIRSQSNIYATGTIGSSSINTRDKLRVWDSGLYTIGMKSGYTFGGLGGNGTSSADYAMSFQMSGGTPNRGFYWGTSSQNDAKGAMALTNEGKLTVADSIRLGYGETDTVAPGITYPLEVNGDVKATSYINQRVSWNTSFQHTSNNVTYFYYIPTNNTQERNINLYWNNWIAQYGGRVKKVVMRNTGSSTVPTATTIAYKVTVNGTTVFTSGYVSITGTGNDKKSSYTFTDTDATFNEGDRVQVSFNTNGDLHYTAVGISLEYTE